MHRPKTCNEPVSDRTTTQFLLNGQVCLNVKQQAEQTKHTSTSKAKAKSKDKVKAKGKRKGKGKGKGKGKAKAKGKGKGRADEQTSRSKREKTKDKGGDDRQTDHAHFFPQIDPTYKLPRVDLACVRACVRASVRASEARRFPGSTQP